MLDSDLARLYEVPTMVFNQAIKRNFARFPSDFIFQPTREELGNLKSQIVTSSTEATDSLRSQNVILKKPGRGQHRKYLPWVFTERAAIMAATILRSPRAVAMSVYVVRAFVRMREELLTNAVILKRLAQHDKKLLEHDLVLQDVVEKLLPLLARRQHRVLHKMESLRRRQSLAREIPAHRIRHHRLQIGERVALRANPTARRIVPPGHEAARLGARCDGENQFHARTLPPPPRRSNQSSLRLLRLKPPRKIVGKAGKKGTKTVDGAAIAIRRFRFISSTRAMG
jgi:hypothetical protein